MGTGIVNFVIKCKLSDLRSSLSVFLVPKSRMICFLYTISLSEDTFSDEIEVIYFSWKPWYFFRAKFNQTNCNLFSYFLSASLNVWLVKSTCKVNMEVHNSFTTDLLRRPRVNRSEIDIVFG